ncbi:MAG: non-heme iron oxygenase ferredoxin subunit [Dehalococcoidia bacterium]
MAFVKVGTKSDVVPGEVKAFKVDGTSIVVANIDGAEICAIADLCTHDGGPLGDGTLADGLVECPRHGARFDVRTGAVKALPAVRPVKTYPVKVEDNDIMVDVG